MPRDAAGHLDLNEGTGGIIAMCACDGFLEVYKQDLTYRIQTPETIDPDRTNPHTRFVAAVADNVGSSNPIVARVLLQGGPDLLELRGGPLSGGEVLPCLRSSRCRCRGRAVAVA